MVYFVNDVCCAELQQCQRQSDADQQRLWTDLSAHLTSVHHRDPDVATTATNNSSDPAASQQSQHLAECHRSSVHTAGLCSVSQPYLSYLGQQSSLNDVYSTVDKAGRFCLLTLLFLPQVDYFSMQFCALLAAELELSKFKFSQLSNCTYLVCCICMFSSVVSC